MAEGDLIEKFRKNISPGPLLASFIKYYKSHELAEFESPPIIFTDCYPGRLGFFLKTQCMYSIVQDLI